MPKLSILIPTLVKRNSYLNHILTEIEHQRRQLANYEDVEVIINLDNGEKSTGFKRNECIAQAQGDYVAFVDDDDFISPLYLKKQLDVCNSGMDCGSLIGLYFLNGVYDRPFIHSIQYKTWFQDNKYFFRSPNHLNCLKKSLISDVLFEDIYVGEDGRHSEKLVALNILKTQHEVKEVLYYYYDRTKVNGV